MREREKKMSKPCPVKFRPSTKRAIDRVCYKENISLSYVVERAVRRDLKLDEEK